MKFCQSVETFMRMSALVIVPSIIIYLCMQTFQKSGATAGAVKG